jgi:hypothetical protein
MQYSISTAASLLLGTVIFKETNVKLIYTFSIGKETFETRRTARCNARLLVLYFTQKILFVQRAKG